MKYLSRETFCHVVALTATPGRITLPKIGMGLRDYNFVQPTATLRQFEDKETRRFRKMDCVLSTLQAGEKCIVYTPHITDMQHIRKTLREKDITCEAVWSKSADKTMDDEQNAVLEHILSEECIPAHIDTLIINASCGTCININGKVDKVIVDSYDKDVIVQARGRYREDLDVLYVPDKEYVDYEDVEEYLNIPLYHDGGEGELTIVTLCEKLNFRNTSREVLMFTTVKKRLAYSGYVVTEMLRVNNRRPYMITLPAGGG